MFAGRNREQVFVTVEPEKKWERRRAEIARERKGRRRRDCRQRNQREGKRRRVGRKKMGAQGRSPWLPGHEKTEGIIGYL